jgi:hypothetical protein
VGSGEQEKTAQQAAASAAGSDRERTIGRDTRAGDGSRLFEKNAMAGMRKLPPLLPLQAVHSALPAGPVTKLLLHFVLG